jgi:hypothetical protein
LYLSALCDNGNLYNRFNIPLTTKKTTIGYQQPLLGHNTKFLYKRALWFFPSNYSMLSYRNKIFQLLNIYYNKYLSQTDKRESSKSVLQSFTLKKNTFPHRSYAMAQPSIIKNAHKSKSFPNISLTRQLWNSKYFKIHTSAPSYPLLVLCWRCSCITYKHA